MSGDTSNTILYVDNQQALQSLCLQLQKSTVLALDTEFVREKTYRARLCLIQIASDNIVACVDPLAVDIAPLLDIIYQSDKLKVLHAARQDFEIFYDLRQQLPQPLFDTQLAASLLGYGDQVSYAAMVETLLDVTLEKAQTRTNWCQRPLTAEQLHYASDDVIYLLQLYPLLQKKLQHQQRTEWLHEEFDALCQTDLFVVQPEQAWKKVKGIKRLKPRHFAAAKALAQWREQAAIDKDLPRRWLLPDDILLNIAQAMPKNTYALMKIKGAARFLKKEALQKAVLQAIHSVQQLSTDSLPEISQPERLTAEQEKKLNKISSLIKTIAKEQNISSTQLANRKVMEKAARGHTDIPLLKGWRYQLAGKQVLDIIDNNETK